MQTLPQKFAFPSRIAASNLPGTRPCRRIVDERESGVEGAITEAAPPDEGSFLAMEGIPGCSADLMGESGRDTHMDHFRDALLTAARRAAGSFRTRPGTNDPPFLKTWEMGFVPGVGAMLRARRIRRSNPALAGEIWVELIGLRRFGETVPKIMGVHQPMRKARSIPNLFGAFS